MRRATQVSADQMRTVSSSMLVDPHPRGRASFAGPARHWGAFPSGPRTDVSLIEFLSNPNRELLDCKSARFIPALSGCLLPRAAGRRLPPPVPLTLRARCAAHNWPTGAPGDGVIASWNTGALKSSRCEPGIEGDGPATTDDPRHVGRRHTEQPVARATSPKLPWTSRCGASYFVAAGSLGTVANNELN